MASFLRRTVLSTIRPSAHLVDVGGHPTGDQGFAEAETGLYGDELPAGRDRVGREQDAGRLGEDHLLHDHCHGNPSMVEAVTQTVGHGPLGEQRGPAPADVLEDRRRPHHIQVRVLLAGEGGRRQVLCRRTRSDRAGDSLAEPGQRAGDRRWPDSSGMAIASSVRRTSALRVRIASLSSGFRCDSRSSCSLIDGASSMIRRKASVVTQKPGGTWMPSIRESSPSCAPLPPTTAACVWSISGKSST